MAKRNLRNEVALSDEGSSSKDSQSEERRGACGEGQGPDVVSQVPRVSLLKHRTLTGPLEVHPLAHLLPKARPLLGVPPSVTTLSHSSPNL